MTKAKQISIAVSSIGWRQDYAFDAGAKSLNANSPSTSAYSLAIAGADSEPTPPLPPRNSTNSLKNAYNLSSSAQQPASTTSSNNYLYHDTYGNLPAGRLQQQHQVLDRRKTYSRLNDVIMERRTVDPELLEFFFMVKDLRARYLYDDDITNVGHIIASEFNYYYPPATSIKICVHPSLQAFLPSAQSASVGKGQVQGYAAPVVFTCDSKFC